MAKKAHGKKFIQKYGKGTRRRLSTLGRKMVEGERALVLTDSPVTNFDKGDIVKMEVNDGSDTPYMTNEFVGKWVRNERFRAIEGEGAYFEKGDIVYSKMTDRLYEVLGRFKDDITYAVIDSDGQNVNAKNVELVLHETAGGHVVTPEFADYERPRTKQGELVEAVQYTGKFKVGDRVKIVGYTLMEYKCGLAGNVGKVGTVSGINDNAEKYCYEIDFVGGEGSSFTESCLELVDRPTETSPERVYLAGPISTEGDVMFMSYLAEELRKLGYHVHAPHEDDSINDKSNDPSSDDIFSNDGDAINTSDIVVLVESGREQVGTHMEAGKIIERIESGTAADLELVVFTSNYRVENTQVEDGKASASVNHYALGGYKRAGVWVDGMSAGLIEYMRKRKELTQDDEIDENLYVGDIVRVGYDTMGGRLIKEGSYAVVAEFDSSDNSIKLVNREHPNGLDCWTNHGDVEKLSELELFTKEYAVKECLGDTLFKNSETLSPLKLVNGDVLVTVTKKGLKKSIFKGVYKLHRVDAKAVLESKYGYTNVFPFIGTLHNNYHVERNGKVCNILTGEEVNVRY